MNIYYLHNAYRWFNSGLLWKAKFGWSHMLSRLTSAQNSLGWRQKSQWSVGLLCLQMRNWRDWSWLNPRVPPFGVGCLIKGSVSRSAFNSKLPLSVCFPERKDWESSPDWVVRSLTCASKPRLHLFILYFSIKGDRCKGSHLRSHSTISENHSGGTSSPTGATVYDCLKQSAISHAFLKYDWLIAAMLALGMWATHLLFLLD